MFSVRDEGPLPGFADLLPPVPSSGTIDARYIAEARRAVETADLPVQVTMGESDWFRQIERFLFRKLVRELPEEPVRLPWFECHVPPGGKLTVSMTATSEKAAAFSLKVYGAGLGAGRKLQATLAASSEPRVRCATFGLDLLIKPRVYDVRGVESLEVAVLRPLGDAVETNASCAFCGVAQDAIDLDDFELGEHLDLRRDAVSSRRTLTLNSERWASFQFGFKVQSLPIEPKLETKVAFGTTLQLDTEFPAGALYQSYHRARGGPPQTSMWALQK